MKVAVVGTGTMGSGIAQVCAQAGIDVVLYGRSESSIQRAQNKIEKSVQRMVEKEKITVEQKNMLLSRISTSINLHACIGCSLVIEAVAEDMEVKKELFKQLDEICDDDAILATNTSSLSVTELAGLTGRPDKVIGLHFFNPVPAMKLVELIAGQLTSEEVINTCQVFVKRIEKEAVIVREAPGFVVNRILIPMINEAIGIWAEGIASVEEIDTSMKLGANHPMGPLELGDLIGLDVCLAIMEVLYSEFGDAKYRPHPMLRKMVRAKMLGRKTGVGFYDYRKNL